MGASVVMRDEGQRDPGTKPARSRDQPPPAATASCGIVLVTRAADCRELAAARCDRSSISCLRLPHEDAAAGRTAVSLVYSLRWPHAVFALRRRVNELWTGFACVCDA